MIDTTLETKERRLLELMHPYGTTARCLITIGKAKPTDLSALVDRGLCTRWRPGCYALTASGEIAIGVTSPASVAWDTAGEIVAAVDELAAKRGAR